LIDGVFESRRFKANNGPRRNDRNADRNSFVKGSSLFACDSHRQVDERAAEHRGTVGTDLAWLTLTDGTGAIECAIFPNALARVGQPTSLLREGAFMVANGRLAHEETTGTKLWINSLTQVGGSGARQEALRAALEYRQADLAA
jgi:hypothetical protein